MPVVRRSRAADGCGECTAARPDGAIPVTRVAAIAGVGNACTEQGELTLILPMREKPAAVISGVICARHTAGYVRAGVGDGEGVSEERRCGVGQAEREAVVDEVIDAWSEEAEEE